MRTVTAGFDPALNSPGAAILVNDVLVVCGNVRIPSAFASLPIGERIDEVARLCVEWFEAHVDRGTGLDMRGVTVAYEKPKVRGGPRTEDPNDVLHIGMVGASVWTRMRLLGAARLHAPTPEEWNHGTKKLKRNVPEIWEAQRGVMIGSRLSPAERALVPDKHDALDAVGIALHAVGRLEIIRVNARPR